MEKKEFKKLLSNILKQYGFYYTNKRYYLSNNELIIVIDTQKSNFENSYYLNYGILIKEINPDLEYPKEYLCDIRGRFIFKKDSKIVGGFNLEYGKEDELKQSISETVENLLLPVYEVGVSEYYKISSESLSMATLKTKKYLGIE